MFDKLHFLMDTIDMLAAQGCRATKKHNDVAVHCAYRNMDVHTGIVTRCAIGLHIPDNVYSAAMENGYIASQLMQAFPAVREHIEKYGGSLDLDFLNLVQKYLHDKNSENTDYLPEQVGFSHETLLARAAHYFPELFAQ